ncbi:MAG: NADH-quinone oxidoreductase subunit NuoG [Anaerolineales bacterium]|nr:NADH-quinone oxidoreductase subunit NuoG [Anaerolineales bacterium]
MTKQVTLSIDGKVVSVPEGTLIVNAAKKAGIDIPVFCYHPKMEPVGMCRMCLVEIGRPLIDRATGELVREADGSPKIQFSPKLETACTTPVSEGMVVLGASEKAKAGREDILEFLLTSHPLDCPVCDKGGECPLQNLTMGFGPGQSRYLYDEKMHLAKQVPLGELIFLDRERCIQCGRCVRFQSEIVGDNVIGFYQRGRALEIISYSEPGFDSFFSGNTTDICPVGALTTTDFRFGARPWELNAAASICSHCPVGCNITINVRREAVSDGKWVVKRIMPRQNEAVNEIWICDKGRFAHHYTASPERLSTPLVRKDGKLIEAGWDEALDLAAGRFRDAGNDLLTLASGRLSNEDLFNLYHLTSSIGGKAILYSHMGGGDLTAQVGVGMGTNFADMGRETAIIIIASDLEEEAPIWYLRVKLAAQRGAQLIVINPRQTKLDRYAHRVLRYAYGKESAIILAMINAISAKKLAQTENMGKYVRNADIKQTARMIAEAENTVVLFGSEGLGLEGSQSLAQACANLLLVTGHIERANNGLIGVWPRANDQGAWDVGFRPAADLKKAMQSAKALYIAAADPAGDFPDLAETADFMVVQDLFLTATARLADVVFPAQSFTERQGSFTSGERRVQRFYPAVPSLDDCLPDFTISARVAKRMGIDQEEIHAGKVMDRIAASYPHYREISYTKLSQVNEQWPIVGRNDLYYGGTTYENSQGLGMQLLPGLQPALSELPPYDVGMPEGKLWAVPINRLYDRGQTMLPSKLLHQRIPHPYIVINSDEAEKLGIIEGDTVEMILEGVSSLVTANLDNGVPQGILLVPRSMGIPIAAPTSVTVKNVDKLLA